MYISFDFLFTTFYWDGYICPPTIISSSIFLSSHYYCDFTHVQPRKSAFEHAHVTHFILYHQRYAAISPVTQSFLYILFQFVCFLVVQRAVFYAGWSGFELKKRERRLGCLYHRKRGVYGKEWKSRRLKFGWVVIKAGIGLYQICLFCLFLSFLRR